MPRVDPTKLDHLIGSIAFTLHETVRYEIDAAVSVYVHDQNLGAAHLLAPPRAAALFL